MALRKPQFEAQEPTDVAVLEKDVPMTSAAPADDAPDTGTEAAAPAATDAAPAPAAEDTQPATAAAPASTAIAPVTQAAISTVVRKKYQPALQEYEEAMPQDGIDFNTFPKIVAGLDGFTMTEGQKDLGRDIVIDLMSWGKNYTASPGVDDDDAKDLVRYSLDGKTIRNGEDAGGDILAYVQKLKTVDGYEKAALKEYLAVYGFMVSADGVEIPEEDRSIVMVQIPPQSKAFFTRYQMETGVKISAGIMPPSGLLKLHQDKVVQGSKKYATVKFSRG